MSDGRCHRDGHYTHTASERRHLVGGVCGVGGGGGGGGGSVDTATVRLAEDAAPAAADGDGALSADHGGTVAYRPPSETAAETATVLGALAPAQSCRLPHRSTRLQATAVRC
eukprot:COSAG02_NODE_6023_length_3869_cov_1.528382_4_plen_112_part_00